MGFSIEMGSSETLYKQKTLVPEWNKTKVHISAYKPISMLHAKNPIKLVLQNLPHFIKKWNFMFYLYCIIPIKIFSVFKLFMRYCSCLFSMSGVFYYANSNYDPVIVWPNLLWRPSGRLTFKLNLDFHRMNHNIQYVTLLRYQIINCCAKSNGRKLSKILYNNDFFYWNKTFQNVRVFAHVLQVN